MALWGNVDQAADKPKYLTTAEKNATYGVSEAEAQLPANKAKGVAHAGWVKTTTYTDSGSVVRNKTEVLVAMSSLSSDNNADDTTIGIDPVITIGTQPQNLALEEGTSGSMSVAATVNNGGAVTYQWEVSTDAGVSFAAVSGATSATLAFEVADIADDQNQYRVVVSSTGAAAVTSDAATLTVTASAP